MNCTVYIAYTLVCVVYSINIDSLYDSKSVYIWDNDMYKCEIGRVIDGNIIGNIAGNITGNIAGNIIGNIAGNISGNIAGNISGNSVISAI